MALVRIVLLAFNVAVFTFLVYRILQLYRSSSTQKVILIAGGVALLLLLVIMITGIIRPTMAYLFLYPVAISLYLYLIKNEARG